jgi:hypothetical protein
MGFDKETVLAATDIPSLMRELLPELQKVTGDQALVCCVYHADKTPSLSVKLSTGLHNCKACAAKGGPVDLVMKVHGLDFPAAVRWLADRAGLKEEPQEKPTFKVTGHYSYHPEDGSLAYWKERVEPGLAVGKDGSRRPKDFLFFHNPEGSPIIKPGMGFFLHRDKKPAYKGRGDSEPLPYRLPDLAKAPAGSLVFVPEGEKKCNLLASWLLLATCLDSGGQTKPYPSFVKALAGHNVVILPDNDSTGEAYAAAVAAGLHGVAASIKVLRLPGLEEKGDIIDWAGKK